MNYKWKGAQSERINTNKVQVSHDTVLPVCFNLPLVRLSGGEKKKQTNLQMH